jgi:hypothetical protein
MSALANRWCSRAQHMGAKVSKQVSKYKLHKEMTGVIKRPELSNQAKRSSIFPTRNHSFPSD